MLYVFVLAGRTHFNLTHTHQLRNKKQLFSRAGARSEYTQTVVREIRVRMFLCLPECIHTCIYYIKVLVMVSVSWRFVFAAQMRTLRLNA